MTCNCTNKTCVSNTFCSGRSLLYAVDSNSQVIAAAGTVNFGDIVVSSGRGIGYTANSSTVSLIKAGVYKVTVSADILADAAGSTTLALYNNGTAVSGAEATYTAVASDIAHVSFSGLIQVNAGCRCVCTAANLTAQLSVAGAVSNVAVVVEKVA